jgi:hypothetical protein
MPRLIESLKKKALDSAVANGHNLGKFQRVQGGEEVHMAACKDCGSTVEIVDGVIGGTALEANCGEPALSLLPLEEAMEVIAMKTEPIKEGDGVMFPDAHTLYEKVNKEGIGSKFDVNMYSEEPTPKKIKARSVPLEEILARGGVLDANEYVGRKTLKPHFHYVQHRKYAHRWTIDTPKREGRPVSKERPRYATMPDGTTYDMRHSGWVRTTSRKCENKEYDFHNNSTRRRLA